MTDVRSSQVNDLLAKFGSFDNDTMTSLLDETSGVVSVTKLIKHLVILSLDLVNDNAETPIELSDVAVDTVDDTENVETRDVEEGNVDAEDNANAEDNADVENNTDAEGEADAEDATPVSTTKEEDAIIMNRMLIKNFVDKFSLTVAHFIDCLDYNADNEIDLVSITEEDGVRTVKMGADVQAFLNDTGFTDLMRNGTAQDKIMTILTTLLLTMDDAQIQETHEDVQNFKGAINETYTALKELKNLSVKPAIVSKKDEIMRFVVTFSIVLLPVIDILNRAVAGGSVDISNEAVTEAVHGAYGHNLDIIIKLANDLAKKAVRVVDGGIKQKLKKLFCCK